jgi:hypothetical protein
LCLAAQVLSEEFSAAFTTPACRTALLDVVGGSPNNVDDAVVVTALRLLGCTRTVAQPRLADDASSPPTSIAVPRRSYVPPHLRRDSARACHICAGTRPAAATSAPGLSFNGRAARIVR